MYRNNSSGCCIFYDAQYTKKSIYGLFLGQKQTTFLNRGKRASSYDS